MKFKYGEDKTLEELRLYIEQTYEQHYVAKKDDIQLMDLFFADEDLAMPFCKTNAIKYIMRYGKKSGKNRSDQRPRSDQ